MIRNDTIEAELAPASKRLVLANPRIHADHDAAAFRRGLLDHGRTHPVAVRQTMWDVDRDIRAERAKRRLEHHRRDGAVHVVVPVNQNFLSSFHSPQQSRYRGCHSRH